MFGGKVFRHTSVNEKFANGNDIPVEYEKNIVERLSADRSRFITEIRTKKGIEREELITIGNERFIRENDGEWKILVPTGLGRGEGSLGGKGENDPKVEYIIEKNLDRNATINGQKVSHFEEITRSTYTYPTKIEKKVNTLSYWFNADGLLVKRLDETKNETTKEISRETDYYEYDIDLKIERPILSGSKVLDEKNYNSIILSAYKKTEKQKHRIVYQTENSTPNADDKRLLESEYIPSDKYHFFYDFFEGDRLRRYEKIKIGDVEYEKYDDDTWKKKTEPDIASVYSGGFNVETSYEDIGQQMVNGQSATLYQRIRSASGYPDGGSRNYETRKHWINDKGLIVKYSFTSTDGVLYKILNTEEDYEYDASIKIEAPKIKK